MAYDMIPQMYHKQFHQFWGYDVEAFLDYVKNVSPIPLLISDNSARTLYGLLLAEYANSTIANADEDQFKLRLCKIIFMYGPTWEKRLEVQKKVRELTDDEIFRGSRQIINKALHPGTEPSTATLEELPEISEQNTINVKRDKLTGYSNLLTLLETDVTAYFLDRFKELFLKVVAPQRPLLYENIEEDDEE